MRNKIDIEKIIKNLKTNAEITLYECTDSTNTRLKEKAKLGANSKTVIIAENQTNGRGRLGRKFYSPNGGGIYMSLLALPTDNIDLGMITAYTAVAVCRSIETVSKERFTIKWVNDIIKDNKKVCGILAESGVEQGETQYVIVGIGINVYPPKEGFPEDIQNIAGSVFDSASEDVRSKIIAEIINNFYSYSPTFIDEYKSRSCVLGTNVNVHKKDEIKKAFAYDIDKNCNLLVEYENGEKEALSFGEISIRPIQE